MSLALDDRRLDGRLVERARETISANLAQVRARIAEACARAGRSADEVSLVAVTKTRTPEEVAAAHACGAREFGENRIEELEEKLPHLSAQFAADPPRWHMIGHVQSRKSARVAQLADVVHSVDSIRLARRLDAGAAAIGRRLPILLEINVSGEASKYGFPAWDDESREALLAELAGLAALSHLDTLGLMTMAPIAEDPEAARPVFVALRALRDMLRVRVPVSSWDALSMGMTDDYPVAVEEGATLVRVGRAVFGPRVAE